MNYLLIILLLYLIPVFGIYLYCRHYLIRLISLKRSDEHKASSIREVKALKDNIREMLICIFIPVLNLTYFAFLLSRTAYTFLAIEDSIPRHLKTIFFIKED